MSRYGRKVKIFSALEVANICGVVNQTAINWIKHGYLKAFTTPGGQYRVYAKDLVAFLDTRGMVDSGEALQVFLEKADWGIILIATENQTLGDQLRDEIKNQLPDHDVFIASDAFDIGRILSDTKPGFIVLDKALPGVDSSRLIHTVKEDPSFGKPYVFIMNKPDKDEGPENADGFFLLPEETGNLVEMVKSLGKQGEAAFIA